MAQLYFRAGLHELPAHFEHSFRSYPNYGSHSAGYGIMAGLQTLIEWMLENHLRPEEIEYLRRHSGRTGQSMFKEDFLHWLHTQGSFDALSLQAIPEGRVVHAGVPLTVVTGPLAVAQIVETSLLNRLNYQILVATKAARLRESAEGGVLIEFGCRRAQDQGANAGTRAALIGGADFSSNTGMSYRLGYPPRGTHAHSLVQVFMALGGSELDAFRAYAEAYPDDCVLLVDTIHTLESGLPHAIQVFEELRRKGHTPVGIRLDSGDLAYLSLQAARSLNKAGFPQTTITLSNQLDELVILQILTQIKQEAKRYDLDPDQVIKRLIFGVGTNLITSQGCPALDGVYKLVAVRHNAEWRPAFKVSDTAEKGVNPGRKRVWRLYDRRHKATADLLCLEDEEPQTMNPMVLRHPVHDEKQRILQRDELTAMEPLLMRILENGKIVSELPSLEDMRRLREADLVRLDPGVKRLLHPHVYHVSLSERLWNFQREWMGTFSRETSSASGSAFEDIDRATEGV